MTEEKIKCDCICKRSELDEAHKMQFVCAYRDITHESMHSASRRGSELSDEFNRLEVQIATVLFVFSGLFINSFNKTYLSFEATGIFLMKLAFANVLVFLVLSLLLGLIHIKRKELFWDEVFAHKNVRFANWLSAAKKDTPFEEALAFNEGTKLHNGEIVSSPKWTWILQTISLGIAVAIMLALALIFLFSVPQELSTPSDTSLEIKTSI